MTTKTPPQPEQFSDFQQQMMEMLSSVQLDEQANRKGSAPPPPERPMSAPAAAQPAIEAKPAPSTAKSATDECPNCAAPEPFKTSEWCPSCGYHPKFKRVINMEGGYEEEVAIDMWGAIERMPSWLWVMITGVVVIIGWGIFIRLSIPVIEIRGPVGLLHLITGLLIAVASHIRAFTHALKASEKTTMASMVSQPVENWRPAARMMPNTRYLFYSLAWGLTIAFVGLVVIDLHWDALFKPNTEKKQERFNPIKTVMQAAMFIAKTQSPADDNSQFISQTDDMEGSLENFADLAMTQGLGDAQAIKDGDASGFQGIADIDEVDPDAAGAEGEDARPMTHDEIIAQQRAEEEAQAEGEEETADAEKEKGKGAKSTGATQTGDSRTQVKSGKSTVAKPDQGDYVICGYTLSVSGEMHSLVIAEDAGEKGLRYTGTVSVQSLESDAREKLQELLDKNAVKKAYLRVPFRVRWAKPVYVCTVGYNGHNILGAISDAELISYRAK